jgi:mycoredoxin-dependent peroxiredoxin
MAPDFSVPTTAGKPFKLSEFKGTRGVVVAFFPAAFTGGCSKEMTAYGANLAKFNELGFEVIGISTDNVPSLKHWGETVLNTKAALGSDFATRATSKAYGVLMPERGIANRATFVVDNNGRITHIEEGSVAVDVTGAELACKRVRGH